MKPDGSELIHLDRAWTTKEYYLFITSTKFADWLSSGCWVRGDCIITWTRIYNQLGFYEGHGPSFEYWRTNVFPEDRKKAFAYRKRWMEEAQRKRQAELRKRQAELIDKEARERIRKEKFEKSVQDRIQQLKLSEREKELSSLFSR